MKGDSYGVQKEVNTLNCYEEIVSKRYFQKDEDKNRVLDLIRYLHEKGYTREEAHRIMELADSTMRRAAQMMKV